MVLSSRERRVSSWARMPWGGQSCGYVGLGLTGHALAQEVGLDQVLVLNMDSASSYTRVKGRPDAKNSNDDSCQCRPAT